MIPKRYNPLKWLLWGVESVLMVVFMALCRILPLDAASGMGAFLGRYVGPMYKAHTIAQKNVDLIFPNYTKQEKKALLRGIWDNLGRVMCEYPHLTSKAMEERITIVGRENVEKARAAGKPVIFISGHFGNWELAPLVGAMLGLPLILAYRPPNNPFADFIIKSIRTGYYSDMFPKGSAAARELIRALKKGNSLGFLVDQRLNDGISVPFLGIPAMTSHLIADLALKYDAVVLPSRVVREKGVRFTVYLYPELEFKRTGNWDEDVRRGTTEVNDLLGSWVMEKPEQWFFVHKRWPNNLYK